MQRDDFLDDLFAAGRAEAALPSQALLARIEADALAQQPRPAPAAQRRRKARFAGWGGVLAGLATATLAGVWIGFAQPLGGLALDGGSDLLVLDTVELIPSYDAFLTEG